MRDRGEARPVQGDGRRRSADLDRRSPSAGRRRALRARVAAQPGRRRLRDLRPGEPTRYTLPAEQALALADEESPFYLLGVYDLIASLYADEDRILEAFRSGDGMGWHEHDHRLFRGTERFFRPGYRGEPRRGVDPGARGRRGEARARREGRRRRLRPRRVDDPHGRSVPELASSSASTTTTRRSSEPAKRPTQAGVAERITFDVATAKDYPGDGLRPGRVFDCLHDMGDPVGASAHIRETLADDGTWMIVEPFAGDSVRGQPQPGRARVLRRLDGDLHARLARPGGRPRARRTGRGGAAHRGDQRGRVLDRAPGDRDAIQPDPRSAAVAMSGPARASWRGPRRRATAARVARPAPPASGPSARRRAGPLASAGRTA